MEMQRIGVSDSSDSSLQLQLNSSPVITDNESTTSEQPIRDHSPNRIKKLTIKSTLDFHLPTFHLPSGQSISNMKEKLFRGKGMNKLKSLSKKRKQRRKSPSYAMRRRVNAIMTSKVAMILMVLSTLYLIFIDDMLVATAAPDNNACYYPVSILKILVFLLFVADLIGSIFVQRLHYVLSFFFVIDLISIGSLVPDIVGFIFGIRSIVHAINALSLGRTARVARIASRLSRVARIINFFNLFSSKREVEDGRLQLSVEPSSIGKKLLSKSTHKIVVMVLVIVVVTSLTSPDPDPRPYYESILSLFDSAATQDGMWSAGFNNTLNTFLGDPDTVSLLYLKIQDTDVYRSSIDTRDWFNGYIIKASSNTSELWIDNMHPERVTAALGITLTVSVIIVLCVATLLMSRDFQLLVIKPIERMVSLIKKISAMDRGGTDGGSDYESSEYDSASDCGESGLDDFDGISTDYDSFSGFDDEPETTIIVELLSDMAVRRIDSNRREKTVIQVETQFTTGMHALGSAAAAFIARRKHAAIVKMYARRGRIVGEMLTTEQTYVGSLGTAIEGLLLPLRANGLLSADATYTIFSNIEVLHQMQGEFLAKLEARVNAWTVSQSIGDVFASLEGVVDMYSIYVNNYNNVMRALDECKKDEHFVDFLAEAREARCKGIDILAYLIMPIQRMPRYVMLLEDLLKHTPTDHFDYDPIANATRVLKKATVLLNERKRESENKTTIQDVYMRLVPPVTDILVPGNAVIVQSKLKQDGDKYHFMLFQTGLLKATKDGHELHVKAYLPIKDISVTVIQDAPSLKIVNALQIKVDDTLFLLFAKTPAIRQEWVDGISAWGKTMAARTKSMLLINHTKRASHRSPSISQSSGTRLSVPGQQGSPSSIHQSSSSIHQSTSSPRLSSSNLSNLSTSNLSNISSRSQTPKDQ
eukprot:gene2438-2771_t